MSTLGGYHEYIGGYHEYIEGISWVHRGNTMSTTGDTMHAGGYHKYIGRYLIHWGIPWVHWGISWVHLGDIMSTSGDVQYIGVFNRNWKVFTNLLPTCIMISPDVLNIPWCTHDIPQCTHGIPQCTEHPPMYSWYPSTCIMISARCTEHPPMYRVIFEKKYFRPPKLRSLYIGLLKNFRKIFPPNKNSKGSPLRINWCVPEHFLLFYMGKCAAGYSVALQFHFIILSLSMYFCMWLWKNFLKPTSKHRDSRNDWRGALSKQINIFFCHKQLNTFKHPYYIHKWLDSKPSTFLLVNRYIIFNKAKIFSYIWFTLVPYLTKGPRLDINNGPGGDLNSARILAPAFLQIQLE